MHSSAVIVAETDLRMWVPQTDRILRKEDAMTEKLNAGAAAPASIFFVTVMHSIHQQRQRTWGWFYDFENAERAVLTNATDMYEAGYYDLAVIEEMPERIVPFAITEKWYSAVAKGNGYPCDYEVAAIEKPKRLEGIVNFAIGIGRIHMVNAGAELEKELAEQVGWRIVERNGDAEVQHKTVDGWSAGWYPILSEVAFWGALKEYAAEAALYRTQWKDTETLLRAVERQRDEAGKHISCAWCEATFEKKSTFHETMEMMADHMLVCEKHPYPEAHRQLEAAESRASTEAERARGLEADFAALEAHLVKDEQRDFHLLRGRVAALQAQLETARRDTMEECCKKLCDCCDLDGPPGDFINRPNPSRDGGPRWVHEYDDGGTIECSAAVIRAALSQLPTPAQVL
jgi:hypothetical protein